ncbi:MAG: cupin domain-containing protein [Candidatus Eisenbacteria bacterium]
MKIDKARNVPAGPVKEKEAVGVKMRVLMSEKDGAPNFIMRIFEIEPGGNTLYHTHPWEHEVYVLEGRGSVRQKGKDHPIEQGSFALVAPDEEHQFVNAGDGPLKFICCIPIVRPKE